MIAGRAKHQRVAVAHDLALAIQVILERRMLDRADMVGGDVQERGHVERQPVHALDLVRLRGDLHDEVLHAVVSGLSHHAESVHRLGRGQVGLDVRVPVQAVVHGGEQRCLAVRVGVQHGLGEVRGRSLALGTSDADHGQLVLRASIELRGQQAHGLARVIDDQAGCAGLCRKIGVGHVCGQPALVDVMQILGLEPPLAAQQRALAHVPRVIGDRRKSGVSPFDVVRIKRPTIRADDLPKQTVPLEQLRRRCQRYRHTKTFPHGAAAIVQARRPRERYARHVLISPSQNRAHAHNFTARLAYNSERDRRTATERDHGAGASEIREARHARGQRAVPPGDEAHQQSR